jgi:hypothetical protein
MSDVDVEIGNARLCVYWNGERACLRFVHDVVDVCTIAAAEDTIAALQAAVVKAKRMEAQQRVVPPPFPGPAPLLTDVG